MATKINLTNTNVVANNLTLNSSEINLGSWQIKLDGSDLRFVYNGTDHARLTTTGDLIVSSDINTSGSP